MKGVYYGHGKKADHRLGRSSNKQKGCGVIHFWTGLSVRAIRDGKISPPPVVKLIGYQIKEVDHGFAAFELHPGEHHYNPFATVHGGILSTLLDTIMTAAVLTTLPQNITCSTVEIKVNFIKPVSAESKLVRCEARTIHIGRKLATVGGRIKGGNDELYAHGVSNCLIFKVGLS